MALISVLPEGLYCKAGGFFVDPWQPVDLALITHAHSDHARPGSSRYIATHSSAGFLQKRLGDDLKLDCVDYGKKLKLGKTWVSFHPAGHVLGSAQVRIEHKDKVWVVSGDYKRCADPTCTPFEVVPCDTFITEATFGLPIYHWKPGAQTVQQIYEWWQGNAQDNTSGKRAHPSILFCYAFGKAQRILRELAHLTDQPIYVHGAIHSLNQIYQANGVPLPKTISTSDVPRNHNYAGALILSPPSGYRSSWMKRFRHPRTAFASGWMAVREARRQQGYEHGFALSDHADWPGLVSTILATGAKTIYVTHGQGEALSHYLQEVHDLNAQPLDTLFEGEVDT